MRSSVRRVLTSALILTSTASLVSGCASARPIVTAPSACSSLVAGSLRADVQGVDLPPADATAGALWTAFDGQTGRLDQANTMKAAAIETIEKCEARDKAVADRLSAPFWKRPFMRVPDG